MKGFCLQVLEDYFQMNGKDQEARIQVDPYKKGLYKKPEFTCRAITVLQILSLSALIQ